MGRNTLEENYHPPDNDSVDANDTATYRQQANVLAVRTHRRTIQQANKTICLHSSSYLTMHLLEVQAKTAGNRPILSDAFPATGPHDPCSGYYRPIRQKTPT